MNDLHILPRENMPRSLLEIPQPPEKLYIAGALPPDGTTYLAVVGSRKHTPYGKEACEKIIAGLAGYPVAIVSGLALGMDAIAHRAALAARLKTLAFPGSGLSEEAIHPKTHIPLAREILEKGGGLLSEFEPGFRATLWSFAKRNRLMAGIAKAVLVIEAEERSGTLITARLAVEYNRDLLAVPGSIFSPNSRGTHALIRQGATPVTCAEDVLDALGFPLPKDMEKQKSLFDDVSPTEKRVFELLLRPLPREELLRALKMPESETQALLSVMEIKGLIREEMGEIRAEL